MNILTHGMHPDCLFLCDTVVLDPNSVWMVKGGVVTHSPVLHKLEIVSMLGLSLDKSLKLAERVLKLVLPMLKYRFSPLLLVIDGAHILLNRRCRKIVKRLVKLLDASRNYHIHTVLITRTVGELHKDVVRRMDKAVEILYERNLAPLLCASRHTPCVSGSY